MPFTDKLRFISGVVCKGVWNHANQRQLRQLHVHGIAIAIAIDRSEKELCAHASSHRHASLSNENFTLLSRLCFDADLMLACAFTACENHHLSIGCVARITFTRLTKCFVLSREISNSTLRLRRQRGSLWPCRHAFLSLLRAWVHPFPTHPFHPFQLRSFWLNYQETRRSKGYMYCVFIDEWFC